MCSVDRMFDSCAHGSFGYQIITIYVTTLRGGSNYGPLQYLVTDIDRCSRIVLGLNHRSVRFCDLANGADRLYSAVVCFMPITI